MVYSVRCRYFAALVGRQWECFSNELRTVLLRLKRAFSYNFVCAILCACARTRASTVVMTTGADRKVKTQI